MKLSIIPLLVISLFTPLANAAASLFDEGSQYFKQGEYAKALVIFKQQESQGDQSASLYYNIASSYFKLQQYDMAKAYFEKLLANPKMRGLAQYNIALIEMKTGNTRKARKKFEDIIKNTTNDKLRKLSQQQLKEVKRLGNNWNVSAAFNLGYDDNITAAPIESALDQSDSFYDFFLYADKVISGHRSQGWLVETNIFSIDFNSSDSFDEDLYSVGVRYETTQGDIKYRSRFAIDKNYFAEDDYQTSLKLEFSGRYKYSIHHHLGMRYRYQDISSDNVIFDYLEGTRHRFRVDYNYYSKRMMLKLFYELENNDRGTLRTINYTYDYSPVRNTIFAKYTYVLDKKWDLIGQVQYKSSDFPSSVSFDRNDDQLKLTLGTDYRPEKGLKIKAKIQYTENDSSVEQYDYNKTIFMLGVSKLF